ncbi:MAG TPA: cupin domain-containing protein [Jiangellaceae bacterium]|nr:cupin domain-containing protein [Jiangellaceae bacterium]
MAGKVNLQDQFARFDDYWSPKIVASVNDYDVKLVKVRGEFGHQHDETDEVFLVTTGQLRIQLQDGDDVVLSPGELFVVPRGVRHRPVAVRETYLVLLEPMRPSTPATPSWRARWVNGSIDRRHGGIRTASSSKAAVD